MADRNEGPTAVKVEEHSRGVVLTYFQGDINSMVDAHFTRALSKASRSKAPAARTKKARDFIKLEESSACQGSPVDCYSQPHVPPPERLPNFAPAQEALAPWHSFSGRAADGPGLPSLAYPLSPRAMGLAGQQYATSLLNLLHNDRGEMGPSVASGSKPELHPSWPVPQGFRDSVDPAAGFEPGRRLEKKDLHWY
ncbi:transcription cofactor vestigial-like protein 1 isoform 2-T2 [Spinachia spinachia]